MAYRDEDTRSKGEEPSPLVEKAAPAASAPQGDTAASPPVTKGKAKRGPGKKPIILAILLAALGFGGYEGFNWWKTGRFMVSTDDAYVQADITIMSAKISGYIQSVAVTNNQSVKAGDLIAKIDDGDYRLALQSAQDKLATQQSAVSRIGRQIEAAKASVEQARAQVAAAQADAERAAGDFARQQQLAQSNYASKATFETAKAERDRTIANVRSAEAALALAQANVDVLSAQREEAQRAVAEQQTAVEKAERDLSFTEIRSPVDGVVGNKAVEVGTFVQPGARLAALVPLTSVHVDANFKETQLADLKPGQKVHVEVDAFPDTDIVGTVESVSPASGSVFSLLPPENATGNFTKIVQRVPVRITVSDEAARKGMLRPGLSVVVNVDTRDHAPSQTAQR
ncbi:HlyD family secretion protein [Microvirga rosea]|uniref:HlyD family secretion protein n=1 Tax=Microvirga rosea TaxID=2715425 RepID=UPI001D09D924|nr:HlyD family secretion protein [Microvirga rosea]MCB8819819.1 HlyD family secretion protein [Microvirga rosea]